MPNLFPNILKNIPPDNLDLYSQTPPTIRHRRQKNVKKLLPLELIGTTYWNWRRAPSVYLMNSVHF